jgi:hypothetical protein
MRKRVVIVPLAGLADTGGGIGAWQNPEAVSVIVTRIVVNREVASAGACTADIGQTATSATTSSDNLIDGVSLNATGLVDNINDAGTNGKARQLVAAGNWITFSRASGASASFVGKAYIEYVRVS